MLSAKAEDMDKILGLMTGADDYMISMENPIENVHIYSSVNVHI